MTYHDSTHIDEVDAKSGRKVKGMRTVLTLSTVSAAVLLLGIFIAFAV